MKKLIITNINQRTYTLKDVESEKMYNFDITFFDIGEKIGTGDYILMSSELLNPNYPEYSTEYYFGPLNQPYGRKIVTKEEVDYICLISNNKTIELKRFFG